MERALGFAGIVVVAACSATPETNGFQGGTGGGASTLSGSGSTTTGELFDAGDTSSSNGASMGGCSEEAKLVYIIGDDNALFSFYPPTLEIALKGYINCPQGGGFATPFSMAVDRQGVAWVLFSDGKIYHVNTSTAACTATSFQPGQQGFVTFGMGFVSDTNGSTAETLHVADYFGSGIAKIDTQSLVLSFIGPYDQLQGQAAELTGTGDSRLFGFYAGTPVIVAEIDKSNGNILSQAPQPSINIGSGWAFAFWGGDFWLFTSPTGDSQIDRYQPSTNSTSTVKTNLGSNIVGAGVSTCAPVEPPN